MRRVFFASRFLFKLYKLHIVAYRQNHHLNFGGTSILSSIASIVSVVSIKRLVDDGLDFPSFDFQCSRQLSGLIDKSRGQFPIVHVAHPNFPTSPPSDPRIQPGFLPLRHRPEPTLRHRADHGFAQAWKEDVQFLMH
jgi:hypothetical protein